MVTQASKEIAKALLPYSWRYIPNRWNNRIKRIFLGKKNSKYLFILSPPYCGSTLLNEMVSSSKSVSVNNPFGTREGQTLPKVREFMFGELRWDENIDFDWSLIKNEWLKHWDTTKPVLLEKSPPNILRTESIEREFDSAYYIVFHRNPYAHCESLIRREDYSTTSAAEFALKCLEYQMENSNKLKNSIKISYELLTENVDVAIQSIRNLLVELKDISIKKHYSSHNYLERKLELRNLNSDKIAKLSSKQIAEINTIFRQKKAVMDYFNYSIIE